MSFDLSAITVKFCQFLERIYIYQGDVEYAASSIGQGTEFLIELPIQSSTT